MRAQCGGVPLIRIVLTDVERAGMATSASVYNHERTTRQILKRHRKDPASLVVHLHAQYMRFEKQVRRHA